MASTSSTRPRRLRAMLTAVAEAVLFVLGLTAVVADDQVSLVALVSWNVLALVYLVAGGRFARREPDGPAAGPALGMSDRIPTALAAWFRAAFPVLASVVGLVASLTILLDKEQGELHQIFSQTLGVTTMVLAWLLLHVGYALRYEWMYARDGGQGFSFPETSQPRLVDFLYFALTLGTTFATSDVTVTRRQTRWTVMLHSVLGFFYNAIVLAVAFKLLTDN